MSGMSVAMIPIVATAMGTNRGYAALGFATLVR